jgi:hypothetical protein
MGDKKLNLFLLLFVLFFMVITYLVLSNNRLPFLTQAAKKDISIEKCLVIATKFEVQADGVDASKISVFVRNEDGLAIADKQVSLATTFGQLTGANNVSDRYGKVEFTLTSLEPGEASVTAAVENQPLPSGLTVKFISSN